MSIWGRLASSLRLYRVRRGCQRLLHLPSGRTQRVLMAQTATRTAKHVLGIFYPRRWKVPVRAAGSIREACASLRRSVRGFQGMGNGGHREPVSASWASPPHDFLYGAKYFIVDRVCLFVRRGSKPILEAVA